MQANIRQIGGAQGQQAAAGLEVYVMLFTAAEPEVDQFGIALRINSAHTVELVKRIQFTPGGSWSKLAAETKPVTEELLSGLPAGPFVMAAGGVLPAGYMEHLMKFSVDMMKNNPMYNLTAEQAQKYGDLSTQSMQGVRSMEMLMGVAEPGTGLYGNTTAIMKVDDSTRFLDSYEKTLTAMREIALEAKSPALPAATTKRVKVGERDAIEISMDFPNLSQAMPGGGPNPQRMLQAMLGPGGKLTMYLAAVDENTVIMSYISAERLQSAIYFFESKQPGLLNDAGVAEVAAALPAGAQVVGYMSLDGMVEVVRQLMPQLPRSAGGEPAGVPAQSADRHGGQGFCDGARRTPCRDGRHTQGDRRNGQQRLAKGAGWRAATAVMLVIFAWLTSVTTTFNTNSAGFTSTCSG